MSVAIDVRDLLGQPGASRSRAPRRAGPGPRDRGLASVREDEPVDGRPALRERGRGDPGDGPGRGDHGPGVCPLPANRSSAPFSIEVAGAVRARRRPEDDRVSARPRAPSTSSRWSVTPWCRRCRSPRCAGPTAWACASGAGATATSASARCEPERRTPRWAGRRSQQWRRTDELSEERCRPRREAQQDPDVERAGDVEGRPALVQRVPAVPPGEAAPSGVPELRVLCGSARSWRSSRARGRPVPRLRDAPREGPRPPVQRSGAAPGRPDPPQLRVRAGGPVTNERLEFLGDAVLGIVVTDMVYRAFPQRSEGELAKLRAAMVNMSTLASVAGGLGLGEAVLLGKGEELSGGREKACDPGRRLRGRPGSDLSRPGPAPRPTGSSSGCSGPASRPTSGARGTGTTRRSCRRRAPRTWGACRSTGWRSGGRITRRSSRRRSS